MSQITLNPNVAKAPRRSGVNETWATIHDSASGNGVDAGDSVNFAIIEGSTTTNQYSAIGRGGMIIDVSGLAGATVKTGTKIRVYVDGKTDQLGGSGEVALVNFAPASNTDITTSDFTDGVEMGTTKYATNKTIASVTTSAYNEWTLDATGLAALQSAIDGSGWFYAAFRIEKDRANTTPTWGNSELSRVYGDFNAGAANPIQMVVEYEDNVDPGTWSGIKRVTIDATKVAGSGNHTNFPVLIKDSNIPSDVYAAIQTGEINAGKLLNDPKLQGYWRLESSGADSSPNGYTVAPGSAPSYVTGLFGNGGDFEAGSNNRLTLANASCPNLEITGSQTWSCWFKPESIGANQTFMSKRQAGGGTIRELYIETDGKPTVYFQGLTTNAFVHSTAVAMVAGGWYHVVGRYDSIAQTLSIWINGVKTSVTASGSLSASTGDWWLGISGYSTTTAPADGILDDCAVWNRALSDAEILSIYKGGADIRFTSDEAGTTELAFEIVDLDIAGNDAEIWVKVPTLDFDDDTVFYMWYGNSSAAAYAAADTYGSQNVWSDYEGVWHLNENGGNRADSSPNGYALTDTNTVASAAGKIGIAGDFEASASEYLTIADASSPNLEITGSFYYSAWIKPESINAYQNILGKTNSANTLYHTLLLNSSNQARIYASGLTTNEAVSYTGATVSAGTFYHIAGMYDSGASKLKVFLNANKAEVTASGSSTSLSTTDFSVGRGGEYNGEYTDGLIDEVRVRNSAVSDDWVTTEYNNQNDPATFLTIADVATPVLVQKTLQYAVLTEGLVQKDLDYMLLTDVTVQKTLQYMIWRTVAAITKGLTYVIAPDHIILKALDYYILRSTGITKDLAYRVLVERSITKAMAYAIFSQGLLQKTLEYRLLLITAITKDMQYTLLTEGLIQKTLEYQIGIDGYIFNYTPRNTVYGENYQYTERGNEYTDQYS